VTVAPRTGKIIKNEFLKEEKFCYLHITLCILYLGEPFDESPLNKIWLFPEHKILVLLCYFLYRAKLGWSSLEFYSGSK